MSDKTYCIYITLTKLATENKYQGKRSTQRTFVMFLKASQLLLERIHLSASVIAMALQSFISTPVVILHSAPFTNMV